MCRLTWWLEEKWFCVELPSSPITLTIPNDLPVASDVVYRVKYRMWPTIWRQIIQIYDLKKN
jgi:hypothetical protein